VVRQHPGEDGRAAGEGGDALLLQGRDGELRPVARQDDQRTAAIGGEVEAHMDGIDVKERHDAEHALARRQGRQPGLALADVDRHLPMRDIDALGPPAGAAGILQGREIVRRGRLRQGEPPHLPPLVESETAGADQQRADAAVSLEHRRGGGARHGIDDGETRRRVGDDEIELARRIGGVDRHGLRARGMHGETAQAPSRWNCRDQRHPLAAHAERASARAKAGDAAQIFPVIEAISGADQGFARRGGVGGGEHLDDARIDRRQRLRRIAGKRSHVSLSRSCQGAPRGRRFRPAV